MAIETEVKILVNERTFNRLYREAHSPSSFAIQKNLIYMFGSTLVRLREESRDTILTFKGPRKRGKITQREEIEGKINWNMFQNFELARQLMPGAFYYEKRRAISRVPNITICFDILENGAKYIELEGSKDEIQCHKKRLGLDNHPIETRSYYELLNKSGDKNGVHRKDI